MYTSQQHEVIFSRDREMREGEGGVRQFLSYELIGVPTGWVYRTESPQAVAEGRGGMLSGQPQHDWHCRMSYSDGSVHTVASGMTRSVPTLA